MSARDRRGWIAGLLLAAAVVGLLVWIGVEATRPEPASRSEATPLGSRAQTSQRGDAGTRSPRGASRDAGIEPELRAQPIRLSAPVVHADPSAEAGILRGRVLAFASGRPIEGAALSFENEGRATEVHTGADGAFELAPDREGAYVLALAMADGFLPFAPEWGHSPVRWRARRGARLEGVVVYLVDAVEYVARVRDAAGPVPGARVRIFGVERGERTLAPLVSSLETDANGEARFVAPDEAVVEASHPERGRGRARIDHSAQASRRISIRLSNAPGFSGDLRIAGRVVDANGEAIGGAVIEARHASRRASAEARLHPEIEATSGDDGSFVLEDADEGRYRLRARARGYAQRSEVTAQSGSDGIVLQMRAEARLRARVVDEEGRPVHAITLVVTRMEGPIAQEILAVESTYDAEGEIEVGGLPTGMARAIAIAPGHAPSAPVEVALREGEERSIELHLSRGGRITGRVVSEDGAGPIEGARVTLEGRMVQGSSAVPLEASVLSGEDGSFAIEGVSPGLRSIAVWASDHHGRIRSGILVEGARDADVGAIDLAPVREGERPRLELAGIGAVLSAEGDALVIGQVVEGGGAASAGLAPGDGILEVDGARVVELGFEGTIERIRGPEGTSIRLLVRRADGQVELTTVQRRRVRV